MQLIFNSAPSTDRATERTNKGILILCSMGLQTADSKHLNLKSSYFNLTLTILVHKVLTTNVACVHVLQRFSIESVSIIIIVLWF